MAYVWVPDKEKAQDLSLGFLIMGDGVIHVNYKDLKTLTEGMAVGEFNPKDVDEELERCYNDFITRHLLLSDGPVSH